MAPPDADPGVRPRETEHYDSLDDGAVRCRVCPRTCGIPDGGRGICESRLNRDGSLYLTTYGRAVSTSIDPIEKKPLFHVAPGASVLSVATKGCNFKCDFCQNYRIAIEHEGVREMDRPPKDLAERTESDDIDGLAYTYTEPTIFMEYALDTMRAAPANALQVFVSNGYMREETVETLAPHLDAINVDIKGGREFYREHAGVPDPEPIFETVEQFATRDVHVEVTNLLIPGENDDEAAIRERVRWLREDVGVDVPGHESESTYCPECGRIVVRREGFTVREITLEDGACPACGHEIPIRGTPRNESSGGRFRPFA